MSALTEVNDLTRAENGVFHFRGAETAFDYSDGEQTESRLHEVLSKAQDLSSSSDELRSHICDWPTEYHLSESRANLLRPLDLTGVRRVLELGCGCGSISRYLGEQPGLQIDSVEGSATRANLAALRCRDLPNVNITAANFNDLQFPEKHYDLVLFVGVTEYAGRFSSKDTDQEALQDLLALGKRAAKIDGVTIVAIENRLGLKYMQGACEDHYAVPFVGLDNYPESTGIRTYSKTEWQAQLSAAGYDEYEFAYPFPDYKVPTLLLSEAALATRVKDCALSLQSIRSRDYSAPFDLGDVEARLWHGLLEAGTLSQHANSFLLLVSDSKQRLDQVANFSIAQYDTIDTAYELPQKPPTADTRVQRLNRQLKESQQHADNLQHTIDVISSSAGWRWLTKLRRFFGRASIK